MVAQDQFPRLLGRGESAPEPHGLFGRARCAVALAIGIGIEHEEVDGAAGEVVVPLIARKSEVVQVGLSAQRRRAIDSSVVPVSMPEDGPEAICGGAATVRAFVWIDVAVIELPHIAIDRGC